MEKKSQNLIIIFVRSKQFFALLSVLLFLSTYYLIKNDVFVKGDYSRPLPVIVWVDSERRVVESSSSDVNQILKDGGVNIYPEDSVSTDIITDPIVDQGAGQKIIVKKAPSYFLNVDSKSIEVRSWDSKVADLVVRSGITLGAKDQILPSLESTVTPGAKIIVTRINEADIDSYEDVPFETIQKADASISFGSKKVTQAGANGKLKKTYRIKYKNGVEVSRRLVASSLATPVVNKIVTSGSISGRANFGYYDGMVTSFYKGMTGKYLLVTNNSNGKQVKVKIIGSGPFNGPIMDMGTEPFKAIGGSLSSGYLPSVTVQLVD